MRASVRLLCTVVLGVFPLSGCDNQPVISRQPIPLAADFRALHLVDEREAVRTTLDTVFALFVGSEQIEQLRVQVNGIPLRQVAASFGAALYAASMPVKPGDTLTFTVATTWREVHNQIVVPARSITLRAPVADSVYQRGLPIDIEWESTNDGTVLMELAKGDSRSIGDTLWTARSEASEKRFAIPSLVWENETDTTAVFTLWHTSFVAGEGFQGGSTLLAGLGVRRLVRVASQ